MEKINEPNSQILNWVPTKKIGPFIFGDLIDDYCMNYDLKNIPEEFNEKVGWKVYRKDDAFTLFSDGGRIVSVSCMSNCTYKGVNIIGSSIKKVFELLNTNPDSVDTEELVDGPQTVYDFDELGLQVWVKKSVVKTAICSNSDSN